MTNVRHQTALDLAALLGPPATNEETAAALYLDTHPSRYGKTHWDAAIGWLFILSGTFVGITVAAPLNGWTLLGIGYLLLGGLLVARRVDRIRTRRQHETVFMRGMSRRRHPSTTRTA